jgi:general secretion pathway protein A
VSHHLPKASLGADRAALRSNPGSPGIAAPSSSSPSGSLTYEPHYGLKEKPFSLSADPRFLYRSPAHAPAFEELLTGIRRREGLIVLTGEIGTGKTTLIRSVLQHLDRRTFTAFVPDPFLSREDLLKMLLLDFGVVSLPELKRGSLSGASRPDLSYPLYEFLDSLVPLQAFAVLIIDEAQNLSLELLEEIRVLSDLEQREKLLQVVLVGQPELKANLKMSQMRQVDQRVSVRCELLPLELTDVGKYVRHRLSVASQDGNHVYFSDGAIEAIFRTSRGTPRLINLICDRALQRGYQTRAAIIEAALIHDAVKLLGIEVPTAEASGARVEGLVEKTSPADEVVQITVPQPPSQQGRSEFSDRPRRAKMLSGLRHWRMAVAPLIGALLLAGSAGAYLFFSAVRLHEEDAVALPPRPSWTALVQMASLTSFRNLTIARRSAPLPGSISAVQDGSYAIQVASFDGRDRADRLVSELVRQGFRARTVEFNPGPPRGVVLQVRVDGYTSAQDAQRDLLRIREFRGYSDAHLLSN